ncbi:MAG TPA: monooxygenase [Polyangiales bacterium]
MALLMVCGVACDAEPAAAPPVRPPPATSAADASAPAPVAPLAGASDAGGARDASLPLSPEADATTAELGPSYHADVQPILSAHCVNCHGPEGIAPFPLTSYAEVSARGWAVAQAVVSREMPPWPADRACRTYQGETRLSQAQIDVIMRWVSQGMRAGEPLAAPAPGPRQAHVTLPRVDLHLQMDEPHVPAPPAGTIDEHFCFLIDWPERETRYITGFEVLPGNRQIVHHFVGFIVAPETVPLLQLFDALTPGVYGTECGAGSGLPGTGPADESAAGNMPIPGVNVFAVWVPGQGAVVYPRDSGIKVVPGSKILLNMHYNVARGDFTPDQTGFNFQVESQVAREGTTMFVSDVAWTRGDNMLIPAGNSHVVHERKLPLGTFIQRPSRIHHAMLHMHQLGSAAGLRIERAARASECLLDIPHWDFDWQLNYQLTEATDVNPEDSIDIRCTFDNSLTNQPLVNGRPREPRDVRWGENTYDEMCLGLLYITPR